MEKKNLHQRLTDEQYEQLAKRRPSIADTIYRYLLWRSQRREVEVRTRMIEINEHERKD